MGKYKSIWTGPQIDEGVGAARNPDTTPNADSDALITSDAVAKVQRGFAPIESDATASQAYAIGDLLVWGGILYKAKTAIAVNDSFTVGTNIEATTIADKLNNIDTEITANTDTTLTGVLIGNGSKVGTKSLDTSSLTNDADHVPVSSVVKSALDAKADKNDLATIHQTSPTCTETNGIAAGVFFYLDNELVVAKTAIANGATFTNGTNYESPTAGGLNALKSALNNVVYRDWINMGINTTKDFSIPYTNRVYLITWACAYSPGTGAWLLFNGAQQQEVVKLSTNSYANLAVLNATTIRLSYSYTQGVSNGNFSIILI